MHVYAQSICGIVVQNLATGDKSDGVAEGFVTFIEIPESAAGMDSTSHMLLHVLCYTALRYTTLRYTTLRYTTLRYTTLRYTTLRYTASVTRPPDYVHTVWWKAVYYVVMMAHNFKYRSNPEACFIYSRVCISYSLLNMICMYVYVFIYIHSFIHIYIYIYIYTHTHTHTAEAACSGNSEEARDGDPLMITDSNIRPFVK